MELGLTVGIPAPRHVQFADVVILKNGAHVPKEDYKDVMERIKAAFKKNTYVIYDLVNIIQTPKYRMVCGALFREYNLIDTLGKIDRTVQDIIENGKEGKGLYVKLGDPRRPSSKSSSATDRPLSSRSKVLSPLSYSKSSSNKTATLDRKPWK